MKSNKSKSNDHSQKKLESFFSVTTTKRKSHDEQENVVVAAASGPATPVSKRSKTAAENQLEATTSTSITPEQKRVMMEKRALAKLKLMSSSLVLVDPASIGTSWFINILETEFSKPYFKQLSDYYLDAASRTKVFPPREQIFSWTRHCELRDVRVVILGQDPYHGPGQAHGLCFSVQKGVPAPPSLVNMYKELIDDSKIDNFNKMPTHGCLVGWAEQGVLLLNAVLTVEASKANSHKDKGWEKLTTAVLHWISNNLRDVVFLLWGSHAQKMGSVVNKSRHVVLNCPHPSPLSAHRGFFGCKHFSKCNEELVKRGRGAIDWAKLD